MKRIFLYAAIVCSAASTPLYAQTDIPKGFSNGSITLPGKPPLMGYLKDNMRGNSSVLFVAAGTEKKMVYGASDLQALQIDSSRFLSIKGDFFKVISHGELCFLQKASNGSNNPVYNGTEAIFIKGTEGQVSDYFFYDPAQQQLILLTRKNKNQIVAGTFIHCTAAMTKAGETGMDLAQLKQAVDIYNRCNEK